LRAKELILLLTKADTFTPDIDPFLDRKAYLGYEFEKKFCRGK
jgi:hypothetical protein